MDHIHKALMEVGIPPHLSGFWCLHDASELILDDKSYLRDITKRLYPEVAFKNNTTAVRAERTMRHAIGQGFDRAGKDKVREVFGSCISPDKGKATNSEFLAALVLYLQK